MLWLVIGIMTLTAIGLLLLPFRRDRGPAPKDGEYDIEVYLDQLREVEADAARQQLTPEELEGARTEIKRRILAARDRQGAESKTGGGLRRVVQIGAALSLPVVAIGLYLDQGHPGLPDRPFAGRGDVAPSTDQAQQGGQSEQSAGSQAMSDANQADEVEAMTQRLAARLEQEPGDVEGWRMLGWSYLNMGRYADAAVAYGRAAALALDNADLQSSHGEALTRAAKGLVTPDALTAFRRAIAADPRDPRARFFLGLSKEQSGDPQGALADWITIIETAPADAEWLPGLRARATELAQSLGQSLPEAAASGAEPVVPDTTGNAGPTEAEIAAVQQLSPEDQQAMIVSMVEGLAQRLEQDPNDLDGWLMLARSRKVLGQDDAARAAVQRAREVFVDAPFAQQKIAATAQQLGLEATAAGEQAVGAVAAPSEEMSAAVQQMPSADQQAMINDMVDRLAKKLEQDPRDHEGWIRLARSRMVLGQETEARDALLRASDVYADSPDIQKKLYDAAVALGIDLGKAN